MKKLAASCCATILFLAVSSGGAAAATKLFGPEKSDNDTLPINIKAVELSYDNKGENLTAKGDVEIEQGSRLLKADFIKINIETKDTEARGNVELNENGDILTCDSFNINLDTQMGHVENAVLFVKQDNLHITGKDIAKLGANTYEIKQGTITTCDSEVPPWRIDAKKIHVTIDGYATVKDSVFRIKKIPVAYLPFALVPVKTTRQSGLLFPEISQSSRKGVELNNSFFWAMSENTDSTIWLDAASKKGLGTGLEYRFRLKEDSWGKVYGYYADESSNYFDDEYRDPLDRKRQRGYLNFEGEHYFNQDAYVKAQGSYITDRQFYDDYRSEVRRTKGVDTDKVSIGSRPYDESLIFFNKNWESCNFLFNTEYYKNLNDSDRSISQPLPQIAFSTLRLPLSTTPLYYQFDTAYDYFYRQEGVKGHRFDAYPKISLPLNRDGWLKLDTEVGVRAVSYQGIKNDDGENDSAIFPTVDSKLSADFVRVFSIDGKIVRKLRHTISPTLFYQYTANDDQDDAPYFDVPEDFYRVHRVGYYLKNRIAGLFNTPTGDYEEDELGYFLIGQSYNIVHPNQGLYTEGDPDKSYSDVFADLRINIARALYFRTKTAYMHSEDRLRYYKALLTWGNQFDEYFDIGYVYEWQRYEGYRARARFKLLRALFAFASLRYNNNRSDKLDSEFGFDYYAQCWGSQLSMETRGASNGRKSETIFNYKFYLRGLGNDPKGSGL
ncbi:MAG: LPS-assembly protein LptD [Deltaproteobacteria bacterium]|nr:LPS-assembly protein LptD [Deltaproteobacteria bacterium]